MYKKKKRVIRMKKVLKLKINDDDDDGCFFACEDHWEGGFDRRHARRWLKRPILDLHTLAHCGHTWVVSDGG